MSKTQISSLMAAVTMLGIDPRMVPIPHVLMARYRGNKINATDIDRDIKRAKKPGNPRRPRNRR